MRDRLPKGNYSGERRILRDVVRTRKQSLSSHVSRVNNNSCSFAFNDSLQVENGSTCKGATGVLEPSRKFEERYNIGVLKVVSPLQQGQVAVRLFNCSDRPKKVFKGSTVGELCPLVDEIDADSDFCYFIPQTKGNSECLMTVGTEEKAPSMREIFPIDNPSLSENERNSVYEVLLKHPRVVSGGKLDLGEARGIERG